MPELPDLLYIRKQLEARLPGHRITSVEIRKPIILRVLVDGDVHALCVGRTFGAVEIHGPFLRFALGSDLTMVVNLMLAGRVQMQLAGEKPVGHQCISFTLEDGARLNLCDEKEMAKVYLLHPEQIASVPRYIEQGIDILSAAFSVEAFRALVAQHRRKQVRVMINDQTALSAIGNAYADEILFDAGIHPKTLVARLSADQIDGLHLSIRRVMEEAARAVEAAGEPIHVKVREHVKVRNRHGEACPRCGETIRREGVRGYDVFFCPRCQPASRKSFIDWNSLPKSGK
jgi:formamidopyrimidine-DNA glycosylase